jgi:hypothetical protein
LNPGPPQYKSGFLTTWPLNMVFLNLDIIWPLQRHTATIMIMIIYWDFMEAFLLAHY